MDSIPRTSGIYQILCVPTGKVYIGSAVNLCIRHRKHFAALRRNAHDNQHLQRAWNKYGELAFEFHVLELVLVSFVLEREQYWLDKLRPFDKKGFNICPIAGSTMGRPMTDATRQNMSLAQSRRLPPTDETRRAISEGRKSVGKAWKLGRPVSEETRAKISRCNKGRVHTPEQNQLSKERNARWYIVRSPDGKEQLIRDLKQFCLANGLQRTCMTCILEGRQHQHKGWFIRRPTSDELTG